MIINGQSHFYALLHSLTRKTLLSLGSNDIKCNFVLMVFWLLFWCVLIKNDFKMYYTIEEYGNMENMGIRGVYPVSHIPLIPNTLWHELRQEVSNLFHMFLKYT